MIDLIVSLKKEIRRLRKIEHAAWHVCESSEERVADKEIVVDAEDFKKLAALLSIEHPADVDRLSHRLAAGEVLQLKVDETERP